MKKIIAFAIAALSFTAIAQTPKVTNTPKNVAWTPRYVLALRLKQSRISLDPFEHAKDAMNAITFQLPVDKEFYDSVVVGQELVDKMRTGSIILNGSFSSWNLTVVNKAIF